VNCSMVTVKCKFVGIRVLNCLLGNIQETSLHQSNCLTTEYDIDAPGEYAMY
jgi:hypothetical protein